MNRKFVLFLVFLGACFPAVSQAPAKAASPALWKVKGEHGTAYLFGTVHLLRSGVTWETAKVKEAFKASDTLYLEIADLDPTKTAELQPLVMKLGLDYEHPLSSKISKDDVALLDSAVKDLGMPGEEALEGMRPWLVYMSLSALPAMKAGYDASNGVDMVLKGEAKSATKPVKGFETVDSQLHLLADLPEKDQVDLLHQTLVDLPKSVKDIDELAGDWAAGDVDKIASLGEGEMREKYPQLYSLLLTKRNEHFAAALADVLKDPGTGTVFVAVGAAHLAGPDSVQKMLESRGLTVTRVE